MTVGALSAATAAQAYGRTQAGQPASLEGFGAALTDALQGVVDAGHAADQSSAQAIAGTGNLTEVVAAINRAELALQTTTAVRDRMVQAYQEVMRMSI